MVMTRGSTFLVDFSVFRCPWCKSRFQVSGGVMLDHVKPVFLLFLIIIVSGATGGCLAANSGRNVIVWCLLCALFPPLLLAIYVAKPRDEQ